MCTPNLSLLSCVVLAVLVLAGVHVCVAQSRCTTTETSYSPYRQLVYDTVRLTRKNWFGKVIYYNATIPYYATKYKAINKLVEVCCAGYTKDDNGDCKPVCSAGCPRNGHCAAPEKCNCDSGYLKMDEECVPDCKDACTQNEHCVAPNTCRCNEGYEKSADSSLECTPVCSDGCAANEVCVAPQACDCLPGYRRRADDPSQECQPFCVLGCPEHQLCSAPNTCDCQPGFQRNDTNECVPICSQPCPSHSVCSSPGQCTCLPGFVGIGNDTLTSCQPVCSEACPQYSECSAPNECQCLDGYKMRARNDGTKFCEPQCKRDCSAYGQCSGPNQCSCYDGYEGQYSLGDGFTCRPKCSDPCENGFCFAPETCVCHDGYTMGPQNKCLPLCTQDCVNGVCVAPEVCACKPGFKFQDSLHICDPVCEPPCIHAECVAPDTCLCRPNYEPSPLAGQHECVEATKWEIHETTSDWDTTDESSPNTETETASTEWKETSTESTFPCELECRCWQAINATDNECAPLCSNESDRPCKNFSQCSCFEGEAGEWQLACPDDVYLCRSSSSSSEHVGQSQWLPIAVGVAAVTLIAAALLYVSVHRYRNIRKNSTAEESQAIKSNDVIYTKGSD